MLEQKLLGEQNFNVALTMPAVSWDMHSEIGFGIADHRSLTVISSNRSLVKIEVRQFKLLVYNYKQIYNMLIYIGEIMYTHVHTEQTFVYE